ncbi:hypothetical protein XENOCAPTIV_013130, partial [Xenoophorus captivus]
LGRTSLHLVIINWPIIPTTGPKPYSKFWTAVTSAGREGEACLRLLCEHGVNVNAQHSGNTPLHIAAVAVMTKTTKILEEDISCISELLEHGAKPNILNKAGMSPLHQACSLGNEELVDLLLRYGGNVNKQSKAGENCLFLFLDHRPNMRNNSLLKKLLSLSSPLTVCNQNGSLPSSLTQPCFFKQREQLFNLTQQPKTLQDICKSNIYLKHIRGGKEQLRKALPERVFNFVFNQWEIQNISFVAENGFDFLKQHNV